MRADRNSTCACFTGSSHGAHLMNGIRRLGLALSLAGLIVLSGTAVAAVKVGSVVFTRGAVTAHVENQQMRLLGRRAPLYQGDIITTGPKSYAVIRLEDGGRMSLRPNTVFTVKGFSQKKSAGSLVMSLFKGGLRMISGLISKRNPRGVRLSAAGVTIGIRGTEFDARICKNDCRNPTSTATSTLKPNQPLVIGRVALMKGTMSATNRNNNERSMSRGAPLYEGDTLETGRASYAVLAMRDRGRITLKPGTVFRIDKHRYRAPKKQQKTSLFGATFSLLKGGVRVLTGLIAKANRRAFSIRTSQATIGIRGTGFDLDDLGPCTSGAPCGLRAAVWLDGPITATNDKGAWEITTDQIATIAGRNAEPVFIRVPLETIAPRPDKIEIDFDNLFNAEPVADAKPGVYLSCYEGFCLMTKGGETIDLGVGESAYAAEQGTRPIRVEQVQPFQSGDLYLETINREFGSLYEIFEQADENEFACVIQ